MTDIGVLPLACEASTEWMRLLPDKDSASDSSSEPAVGKRRGECCDVASDSS